MKHAEKALQALDARRAAYTPNYLRSAAGLQDHKPGSENRKKGYRRSRRHRR